MDYKREDGSVLRLRTECCGMQRSDVNNVDEANALRRIRKIQNDNERL